MFQLFKGILSEFLDQTFPELFLVESGTLYLGHHVESHTLITKQMPKIQL